MLDRAQGIALRVVDAIEGERGQHELAEEPGHPRRVRLLEQRPARGGHLPHAALGVGLDVERGEVAQARGDAAVGLESRDEVDRLGRRALGLGLLAREALHEHARPERPEQRRVLPGEPRALLAELGVDPISGEKMIVKEGRFGPYVTDGTTNASLRKGDTPEDLTDERASDLLAERRARGPAPKKTAKKAAPRKAPAKKAVAKKAVAKKAPARKAAVKKAPASKAAGTD